MKLTIELVKPAALQPAAYNPRKISDKALRALARLLDEHGFVDPVIARREDRLLIAGHQRLRANLLRHRPDELVPCIFLDGLSDARAKALNIALNNPAAQGEYDRQKLGSLLAEIDTGQLDLPAATGFAAEDLSELIEGPNEDLPPPPEPIGVLDGSEDADKVVVIFEMAGQVYRAVKPVFDELIASHDLACHIRFDGEA